MSPMNEAIYKEAENPKAMLDGWKQMHPLGHVGEPEEVGALILFLASDESSFITGETIRVDGGVVMKGD
jgi:meso-butanediol dehydrogenase / (S,S)-butanediol dehydrogenase / diacetyl reductase